MKKELDNYEEGALVMNHKIITGKRGRPKTVKVAYGAYTKIGDIGKVILPIGVFHGICKT